MITIHFGDLESALLFGGFLLWGLSKLVDAYFRNRIRELEKQLEIENAKERQ